MPLSLAGMGARLTARGHARCNRILDIATALFLERGYDATSLQQIVRVSGGSLSTLYRMFGDKDGLFLAIVHRKAETLFADLESAHAFAMPVAPALATLARMLMEFLLSPDTLAIHRELFGNGRRFPALRRALFGKRAAFIARLAAYLRAQARTGAIVVPDARLAARQFLALVWLDEPDVLMSGEAHGIPPRRRRQICTAAVATFLRGVAPVAAAAPGAAAAGLNAPARRGKRRAPRRPRRRGSARPRA